MSLSVQNFAPCSNFSIDHWMYKLPFSIHDLLLFVV